ncbi:hypothetical protein BDY17DRAFT_11827 [Neohortaea acidophila]|uniref:Uncharacterized protein n=1 Tax=Neohortaea acidophila TaxID=245834 RepID=A0A6A6Q581_9PEZI|nr:uncharacterized protein BDY17DRAFT_11827 [Neohortaea acidophila]KAF2487452.1 hypothetical protein BDY17DRAFT_11827 [Neohortaea acidophila]
MLSSIAGWVEDKATNYLRTGIQAGGTLAGNAVGGVGSLVENAGRTAGNTVSGSIGGVGNTINGYGDGLKRSMSADGPVSSGAQKKTAVKPSAPQAKKGGATGSTIGPQKKPTGQPRPQQALAGKSKQQTTARGGVAVAQPRPGTTKTAAVGRTSVGASRSPPRAGQSRERRESRRGLRLQLRGSTVVQIRWVLDGILGMSARPGRRRRRRRVVVARLLQVP